MIYCSTLGQSSSTSGQRLSIAHGHGSYFWTTATVRNNNSNSNNSKSTARLMTRVDRSCSENTSGAFGVKSARKERPDHVHVPFTRALWFSLPPPPKRCCPPSSSSPSSSSSSPGVRKKKTGQKIIEMVARLQPSLTLRCMFLLNTFAFPFLSASRVICCPYSAPLIFKSSCSDRAV